MEKRVNKSAVKSVKNASEIRISNSDDKRIPRNGELTKSQFDSFKKSFLGKYGNLMSRLAYE